MSTTSISTNISRYRRSFPVSSNCQHPPLRPPAGRHAIIRASCQNGPGAVRADLLARLTSAPTRPLFPLGQRIARRTLLPILPVPEPPASASLLIAGGLSSHLAAPVRFRVYRDFSAYILLFPSYAFFWGETHHIGAPCSFLPNFIKIRQNCIVAMCRKSFHFLSLPPENFVVKASISDSIKHAIFPADHESCKKKPYRTISRAPLTTIACVQPARKSRARRPAAA